MSRKIRIAAAAALILLSGVGATFAMATAGKGLTMLVVPARYSVIQVTFDLLLRRDAVLVAYQGDASTAEPLLHAWNGKEWVHVPFQRYADASFLQVTPSQIILVGDETLLPPSLAEASSWCSSVLNVPSIETSLLVNSYGKVFRFKRNDWAWFAGRYNMDVSDLNEGRRQESWYDRPNEKPRRESTRFDTGTDVIPPAEVTSPEDTPAFDGGTSSGPVPEEAGATAEEVVTDSGPVSAPEGVIETAPETGDPETTDWRRYIRNYESGSDTATPASDSTGSVAPAQNDDPASP